MCVSVCMGKGEGVCVSVVSVVRGEERRYWESWNEYVWVHVCVWWELREGEEVLGIRG